MLLLQGCSEPLDENKVHESDEHNAVEQADQEKAHVETGDEEPSKPVASGEAKFHFIDVGQGDATLLQGPDFTVLIDAGRHDQNDVVPYLKQVGVTEIDLVVGTHPHADHIGQIAQVIEAFPVTEVWMSGDTHSTVTFERVINAIIDHDIDYYEPRAGDVFEIGSLHVKVINPEEISGDFHDGSISLIASYGSVSVLFTGDAERETEAAMLTRGLRIEATIFQLGHHGSSTSNTKRFLEAVRPEVTIYSAGLDNSYGHPHREVIEQLNSMAIPVYGTIENGTIMVTTDGSEYSIDAKKLTTTKKEVEKVADPIKMDGSCIDINSASIDELQHIAHIGRDRAEQLIQLRPFSSIDDLTRINGIGQGRLRDIREEGLACVK